MTKQLTGRSGEALAERYLKQKDFLILGRNFFTRYAEIDIIAKKGTTIYFFEVKTRHSAHYGHPFEAITPQKIRKIKLAAAYYLTQNKMTYEALAVGAIGIMIDRNAKQGKITCIENVDV